MRKNSNNKSLNKTCKHYCNIETKKNGNSKIIHKVLIQNGKGYKSISIRKKGNKNKTNKKKLCSSEIVLILQKKFIPGLFNDCKANHLVK